MPKSYKDSTKKTLEKIGMTGYFFRKKLSTIQGCLEAIAMMKKIGVNFFSSSLFKTAEKNYLDALASPNLPEEQKQAFQQQYAQIVYGAPCENYGNIRFLDSRHAVTRDRTYRFSFDSP